MLGRPLPPPPPPLPTAITLSIANSCSLPGSYKLNLVCRAWREGLVAARAVWECVAIDPRKKASTNRWVAPECRPPSLAARSSLCAAVYVY